MLIPLLFFGAVAAQPTNGLQTPTRLMVIGGPEDSLKRFEAAALKCGLTGVSRVPSERLGTLIQVIGPTSWIVENDGAYSCAVRWLIDHPDQGIGFIGNEAVGVKN